MYKRQDRDSVGSIGVGVPGAVDLDKVRVVEAPNLAWRDVALASELEALCGKKTILGNDADCAVLAETACGAARGRKSAVMLTLGTGVGGGVIIDGRIFSGCGPGGLEPGHMTLVPVSYTHLLSPPYETQYIVLDLVQARLIIQFMG